MTPTRAFKKMKKISVLDRFSVTALQRVKVSPKFEYVPPDSPDLNIALIRTKTKIDKAFLSRHAHLKLVITATSGFDHIDIDEAKLRGVQVAFCPEGNIHSAAELTLMLAFSLARKTEKARAAIRKGNWDRDAFLGTELFQKTWGILGLGRIGRKVAQMATALGMEVVACDPFVEDSVFEKLNVERLGLKELYISSDILSLHVPLTSKTKGIVNLGTMEHMNPDLLLINTSRGGVIREADLIEALRRRMIAGCAMDVFQEEPLNSKSAFLDFDNVVATPHIGGNTHDAFERSCHLAVDRAELFVDGKSMGGNPFDEAWVKDSSVVALDP